MFFNKIHTTVWVFVFSECYIVILFRKNIEYDESAGALTMSLVHSFHPRIDDCLLSKRFRFVFFLIWRGPIFDPCGRPCRYVHACVSIEKSMIATKDIFIFVYTISFRNASCLNFCRPLRTKIHILQYKFCL